MSNFEKEEGGREEKTYWEEIAENKEVVVRVKNSLESEIIPYQTIMDLLLDEEETYVDFMTRTFVYSAIGRKCPIYVAQSPIILSGEYSQERFIASIEKDFSNIPLVIMPMQDSRISVSYDGVANAYRYYKISEFIYANYKPLCSFGEFAVWCARDRYDEMCQKLSFGITNDSSQWISLETNHCSIEQLGDGIKLRCTGEDPFVMYLETIISVDDFDGIGVNISMDYSSSHSGFLQLYYTTMEEEEFSEDKSICVDIANAGTALFSVPVTKHSKIRLDIPEESSVVIKDIKASLMVDRIDWGYDGPTEVFDESGNVTLNYNSQLHNYNLCKLPQIWAETDTRMAAENIVVSEFARENSVFVMKNLDFEKTPYGNYILLSADFAGTDTGTLYQEDDEYTSAVMILGMYDGEKFVEKYRYTFDLQEGCHKYLIRVSTDYYWHQEDINAVQLQCDSSVHDIEMKLLEGD